VTCTSICSLLSGIYCLRLRTGFEGEVEKFSLPRQIHILELLVHIQLLLRQTEGKRKEETDTKMGSLGSDTELPRPWIRTPLVRSAALSRAAGW
jgi:hypothetical protein